MSSLAALCSRRPHGRLIPIPASWGDRQHTFWWVNDIEYGCDPNDRLRLRLHVVVCEERWTTRDREGKETKHYARFAWVSGTPLNAKNVVERCNRAARHRWAIEEHILACKHHGYRATHAFSLNWNALRGWHYLLLLARLLNTLVCDSTELCGLHPRFRWHPTLPARDLPQSLAETRASLHARRSLLIDCLGSRWCEEARAWKGRAGRWERAKPSGGKSGWLKCDA